MTINLLGAKLPAPNASQMGMAIMLGSGGRTQTRGGKVAGAKNHRYAPPAGNQGDERIA
jgi:hypothetical protein